MTTLIPAFRKLKQVDFWAWVYKEFQASQDTLSQSDNVLTYMRNSYIEDGVGGEEGKTTEELWESTASQPEKVGIKEMEGF